MRYIIIQTWDSCNPSACGIFKSESEAAAYIKNYKWDNYDLNNDLEFHITPLNKK